MSAPTPTPRVAPSGDVMLEGFVAKITLASDTNITFWEKGVQPPGMEGGDPIDNSTQYNTKWRTFGIPTLVTLQDASLRVSYDPLAYSDIIAIIAVETVITVTFPAGPSTAADTLAFYGYLKTFEPDEMVEGGQPEATVTIAATNYDSGSGTEEAPVYTAGA